MAGWLTDVCGAEWTSSETIMKVLDLRTANVPDQAKQGEINLRHQRKCGNFSDGVKDN